MTACMTHTRGPLCLCRLGAPTGRRCEPFGWRRIGAFALLLRDDYPSTGEKQALTLDIEYPDVHNDLNRRAAAVQVVPCHPALRRPGVLGVAGAVVMAIGWFVILITGELPRWMFRLLEGSVLVRRYLRLPAFLLTTGRHPPFRLRE